MPVLGGRGQLDGRWEARPSEGSDSASPDNSGLPGQLFSTWGEWVRAGDEPRRGSTVQHTFPGPTQVNISCQTRGESITAEGITNDLWSYLPGYDAWITNIYVRGPAALPGVPDCLSGGPSAAPTPAGGSPPGATG